jgi:hypothetical protein
MLKPDTDNSELYRHFSVNDFDRYDCLKLPWFLYLLLAYLMRAYLGFLFSVSNLTDKTAILGWLFPDPRLFYLSLYSGIPAVIMAVVIALRHPGSGAWVRLGWRHFRKLALLALVIDALMVLLEYWHFRYIGLAQMLWQTGFVLTGTGYLFFSTRLQLALSEFPQTLDAD